MLFRSNFQFPEENSVPWEKSFFFTLKRCEAFSFSHFITLQLEFHHDDSSYWNVAHIHIFLTNFEWISLCFVSPSHEQRINSHFGCLPHLERFLCRCAKFDEHIVTTPEFTTWYTIDLTNFWELYSLRVSWLFVCCFTTIINFIQLTCKIGYDNEYFKMLGILREIVAFNILFNIQSGKYNNDFLLTLLALINYVLGLNTSCGRV